MKIDFDFSLILKLSLMFIPYLSFTFLSTLAALFAGTVVAVGIVKLQLSKNKILNSVALIYVGAIRCTPAIILIFLVFYGLPFVVQLFGGNIINFPRPFFLIMALSILFSATFSEVMRSAYLAVHKGQTEAAISIGLSKFQAFYRIVFPQAFKYAIPNTGNSIISLFKETSLAYTIGVIDLMGKGNLYLGQNYGMHALETYVTVGLIYWFCIIIFERIFKLLDKHFSRGKV